MDNHGILEIILFEAPGDENEPGDTPTGGGGEEPTEPAGTGGGAEGGADTAGTGTGGDTRKKDTIDKGEESPGTDTDAGGSTDAASGEGDDSTKSTDDDTGGADPAATNTGDEGGEGIPDEENPLEKVQDAIARQEIHDDLVNIKKQCDEMEVLVERAINGDLVKQSSLKGVNRIKDKFTETKDKITKILEFFDKFNTKTLKEMMMLLKERIEICTLFMNEFIEGGNDKNE